MLSFLFCFLNLLGCVPERSAASTYRLDAHRGEVAGVERVVYEATEHIALANLLVAKEDDFAWCGHGRLLCGCVSILRRRDQAENDNTL